jgi:AcrR family transcriptional regulator
LLIMNDAASTAPVSSSARARILASAERLFRSHGINATGMELIAGGAPVSKRTLYKHFPDKGALVGAYLDERERRLFEDDLGAGRDDRSPRERILSIFTPHATAGQVDSCPFIAASVEHPDPESAPHRRAAAHKTAFAERLTLLARANGTREPERVASIIALLYDGAIARAQILNDTGPMAEAAVVAAGLLDEATPVSAG